MNLHAAHRVEMISVIITQFSLEQIFCDRFMIVQFIYLSQIISA